MTPATDVLGLLVRGSAGALVWRLAGALLAFALQLLLARWLGHGPYGSFIYAFATVTTLSLVLKLGFDAATVRFLPGYRISGQWDLARGLLRESSRVVWSATACVALGIALFAAFAPPGAEPGSAWVL